MKGPRVDQSVCQKAEAVFVVKSERKKERVATGNPQVIHTTSHTHYTHYT